MRIFSEVVYEWDEADQAYIVASATEEDYEGPITLCGGGDSGQRDPTDEEKRLWAAQASSLEGLNKIAMPNLQTGMNNLGTMANESMDGTLAQRLRGMAGADASVAMGNALTGATQKLERFGSTMNPNALSAQLNDTAIKGAAMKSNAVNMANVAAEDTKWNRNSSLAGLASGQGAQSISGMSSLAGQIGASRQAGAQAEAQSNQGLGMMAAWAANKFLKDGGEVRMANGGLTPFKPTSISYQPWAISPQSSSDGGTSPMGGLASLAMPVIASNVAASALDKVGISGPKEALSASLKGAKDAISLRGYDPGVDRAAYQTAFESGAIDQSGLDAGNEAISRAADIQNGAGDAAMGGSPYLAAGKAIYDIASGKDPGKAVGSAAAGYAGAQLGAQAGTAILPGIGTVIGGALGGLAGGALFADGGEAKGQRRKDMRPGGKVNGPGTTTSDSVKARLSVNEGVVNARAMGLGHDETMAVVNSWASSGGKARDLVLAINDRGLQKRNSGRDKLTRKHYNNGARGLGTKGV